MVTSFAGGVCSGVPGRRVQMGELWVGYLCGWVATRLEVNIDMETASVLVFLFVLYYGSWSHDAEPATLNDGGVELYLFPYSYLYIPVRGWVSGRTEMMIR